MADNTAPGVRDQSPANGSAGVALNTAIYLEIRDPLSSIGATFFGVDRETITVTVEGDNAILNGEFQIGYSGVLIPDGIGGFYVTINPDTDFTDGQTVNVTVNASDLNSTPNAMTQVAYSFTCMQPTISDPVTGMEFVWVTGGPYNMGDNFGDGDANELPVHPVYVDGYYMPKFEVTQAQWFAVMGSNPSTNNIGPNYPVEAVSWDDVQSFITQLNSMRTAQYRLPTEAEWEYAARSRGQLLKYATSTGAISSSLANYNNNVAGTTLVGSYPMNPFGLYDMSGNVWEWCSDWYGSGYYAVSPYYNPQGPVTGTGRILRGGSWYDIGATYPRCAFRYFTSPGTLDNRLGFRLVRIP